MTLATPGAAAASSGEDSDASSVFSGFSCNLQRFFFQIDVAPYISMYVLQETTLLG
jgi:hypothetical protein